MIAVASAAETHVDVVTETNSLSYATEYFSRKHSGLNEDYEAIVKNVVTPANTSVRTVV